MRFSRLGRVGKVLRNKDSDQGAPIPSAAMVRDRTQGMTGFNFGNTVGKISDLLDEWRIESEIPNVYDPSLRQEILRFSKRQSLTALSIFVAMEYSMTVYVSDFKPAIFNHFCSTSADRSYMATVLRVVISSSFNEIAWVGRDENIGAS